MRRFAILHFFSEKILFMSTQFRKGSYFHSAFVIDSSDNYKFKVVIFQTISAILSENFGQIKVFILNGAYLHL